LLEQRISARRDDASDATVAVLRKAAEWNLAAGDWHRIDAADISHALADIQSVIAAAAG
jgi:predicted kinase